MTIYRPGHHLVIPGARVSQPGGAAVPWYLSGGIAAANCAAWQAKGAASQAASYLKLGGAAFGSANIDPTIVGGVAPTWDAANGWTGDGATMWLQTNVVAGATYSMIVRYANSKHGAVICGSYDDATHRFEMQGRVGLGGLFLLFGQGGADTSAGNGGVYSGVACISGQYGFWNGRKVTPLIAPAFTGGMQSITILRRSNPVYYGYDSGSVLAIAIYSVALTDAQVLAVSTAMAAL